MNVVVFGSTGMVGAGVLLECLDDERVRSVFVVNRSSVGFTHPKLREILHADFMNVEPLGDELADVDACFFCLGVTSVGLDEPTYTRLSFDLTLGIARLMASPRLTFCYVSGVGTDSTEHGRTMWARVKGRTENAILALPLRGAYMFRPGFIQPMRGVRSKTAWYQAIYNILAPAYPLLHRLLPGMTITTVEIGRAMINVADIGCPVRVLLPRDIASAAAATSH